MLGGGSVIALRLVSKGYIKEDPMNERLVVLDFTDGEVGVTLGALYRYITVPCALTIVAVSNSISVDDPGLSVDINDDGTAAISAISCVAKATPGTWTSTHMGGTETPVSVAADSVLSLGANAAAAGTRIKVQIWALTGETY